MIILNISAIIEGGCYEKNNNNKKFLSTSDITPVRKPQPDFTVAQARTFDGKGKESTAFLFLTNKYKQEQPSPGYRCLYKAF